MPCHYTIVQYVPDPITDERINIGIMVTDGEHVRAQFLHNWRRVAQFAPGNIRFLKDAAKELTHSVAPQMILAGTEVGPRTTHEILHGYIRDWCNSIQFTPLRFSMLDAEAVLNHNYERFLQQPATSRRNGITRSDVLRSTVSSVEAAIRDDLRINARNLIQCRTPLPGRLRSHSYDLIVQDAQVYFAMQTLSFDRKESDQLENDIDLIAWSISDVKAQTPSLPICVVTNVPDKRTNTYDSAVKLFQDINADVVPMGSVKSWASQHKHLLKVA